jgi:hypothetical protein
MKLSSSRTCKVQDVIAEFLGILRSHDLRVNFPSGSFTSLDTLKEFLRARQKQDPKSITITMIDDPIETMNTPGMLVLDFVSSLAQQRYNCSSLEGS